MASTYSTNLKIELIGTGDQSGTWGTTTNVNLGTAIEEAITGIATANFPTDADLTLTLSNTNTTQVPRHLVLDVTSGVSLTTTRNLIVPTVEKQYLVWNNTTGGQSIVVKTSAGTGITVPNGAKVHVVADGTNVVRAFDNVDINSGSIDGADITVGSGKTLDVSAGTFTVANDQISGDAINGGTATPTTLTSTTVNATTVDTTNIEVTNLKAKDGTAAGSIADATGVVTLSSSVLTTTDINGGTIDGAALGASTAITALTVDGLIKLDGNLDANNNVALGNTALDSLTTGINNTAVGSGALTAATAGSANVAVGFEALYSNTTGSSNVAQGYRALYSNTTGSFNVAQGYRALYSNTAGFSNVALGTNALENNTIGFRNVAIGDEALESNTTSHSNTALGYRALYNNITGSENTALGREAGDVITTGSDNTIIGYNADPSAAAAAGQIVIGSGVTGTADNRITVGSGANIAELDLDGSDTSWAASSDERLKKNIADYTAGVAFISELRPVTYQWRAKCDVPEELSLHDDSDDPVHGKPDVTYHGFVAQEVKQALDNHPEVADGQHFWKLRDDGVQTVAPADLVPILVNAVKELTSRLEAAEAEIQTLKGA